MEDKVKLRVMGISFNPVQNDAFALLLAEENGPMRIPIIIGTPEAQSIAMRMEGVHPPRPMTHDLFCSFAHAFGARLREVFIYKFEDGIFSSEMTFSDGERQVVLDARTSDAVAIAMRTGAPIYTTHAIIDETGIEIPDEDNADNNENSDNDNDTREPKTENLAVEELEKLLARLIADEDYEQAAHISELIKNKRARSERPASDDSDSPDSSDDDSSFPGFPFDI